MLQKLHQPFVADVVKEAPDVRIDDPVHFPLRDAHVQGVQGPVPASSRTKAVTEPQKVLFVDAFQDRPHRLLDNLVFQCRDPQRSHPAVKLGDAGPLGRLGPVCSAVDSSVRDHRSAVRSRSRTHVHVSPSTPGAACFFSSKKLARSSSGVMWCSRLVNRIFLSLRAASRTPSNPRDLGMNGVPSAFRH